MTWPMDLAHEHMLMDLAHEHMLMEPDPRQNDLKSGSGQHIRTSESEVANSKSILDNRTIFLDPSQIAPRQFVDNFRTNCRVPQCLILQRCNIFFFLDYIVEYLDDSEHSGLFSVVCRLFWEAPEPLTVS